MDLLVRAMNTLTTYCERRITMQGRGRRLMDSMVSRGRVSTPLLALYRESMKDHASTLARIGVRVEMLSEQLPPGARRLSREELRQLQPHWAKLVAAYDQVRAGSSGLASITCDELNAEDTIAASLVQQLIQRAHPYPASLPATVTLSRIRTALDRFARSIAFRLVLADVFREVMEERPPRRKS